MHNHYAYDFTMHNHYRVLKYPLHIRDYVAQVDYRTENRTFAFYVRKKKGIVRLAYPQFAILMPMLRPKFPVRGLSARDKFGLRLDYAVRSISTSLTDKRDG